MSEDVDFTKKVEPPSYIIEVPTEYRRHFEVDPVQAWQSFGSFGHHSSFPYFENVAAIFNSIDPDRPNPFYEDSLSFDPNWRCLPEDRFVRAMHIDLSINQDSCGIALCHVPRFIPLQVIKEGQNKVLYTAREMSPCVVVDMLGRIPASKDHEIIYSKIREIVYEIDRRGFPLGIITFDRFQSVDSMQILRAEGFTVANLSMDRTSTYPVIDVSSKDNIRRIPTGGGKFSILSAWNNMKGLINTGRIKFPYYQPIDSSEFEELGLLSGGGKMEEGQRKMTWIEKEATQAIYDSKKIRVMEPIRGSIDLLEAATGAAFNICNNVDYEPEEPEHQKRKREATERSNSRTIWEHEETARPKSTNIDKKTGDKLDDDEREFFDDSSLED